MVFILHNNFVILRKLCKHVNYESKIRTKKLPYSISSCVYLSICLSVCLSVYLSVYLSANVSLLVYLHLPVSLSACQSVSQELIEPANRAGSISSWLVYLGLSVCLFVGVSLGLSVC